MTNYYLIENKIISHSADWKFNENCLETEEDIVRNNEGILMLKSDCDTLVNTDEYKAKVAAQKNAIKITDLQAQIEALEQKQFRSLKALTTNKVTDEDNQKFHEYEAQINALREQISQINI